MGWFDRARGWVAERLQAVAEAIGGRSPASAPPDVAVTAVEPVEPPPVDVGGSPTELISIEAPRGAVIPELPPGFEVIERRPFPSPDGSGIESYEDEGVALALPAADGEDEGAEEIDAETLGEPVRAVDVEDYPPGGRGDSPDGRIRVDFDATVRGRGFQYDAEGLHELAALVQSKIESSNLYAIGATPEITMSSGGYEITIPSHVVEEGAEAMIAFVEETLIELGLSEWERQQALAAYWQSWADAADFDEYVSV